MHGLSWIKAVSVAMLQPLINGSVGRIDGCCENSEKKFRKKNTERLGNGHLQEPRGRGERIRRISGLKR